MGLVGVTDLFWVAALQYGHNPRPGFTPRYSGVPAISSHRDGYLARDADSELSFDGSLWRTALFDDCRDPLCQKMFF